MRNLLDQIGDYVENRLRKNKVNFSRRRESNLILFQEFDPHLRCIQVYESGGFFIIKSQGDKDIFAFYDPESMEEGFEFFFQDFRWNEEPNIKTLIIDNRENPDEE